MNTTDVQGTLREMWETRPARPRDDRQVAGVASGIARRYDIDPVLVRIGFVVAAFSGIGAALYIAGWILLPDDTSTPATSSASRSPRAIAMIGLVVAAAITVGSIFGGKSNVLLPALAVAVLLFLLHHSRGNRTGVPAPGSAAPPTTDGPTVATSTSGPSLVKRTSPDTPTDAAADAPTEETPAAAPPSWDPLGAAPFAWDLPEPAPVPPPVPPQPRRRLPVTPVTLGVALLAGGATAVALLILGALSLTTVPMLFGVVLAVIGIGLVVGAFVRSGRGLIPIALLLSALTWGVLAAPLGQWDGNGFGDLKAAPTTVADLEPSYRRTAGDIDLDLRNLDLTVPAGGNSSSLQISVRLGVGDVQVWVPDNADLELKGKADVGRVAYGAHDESGPSAKIETTDLGADGVASGRQLVLDVRTGAGNVEVHRG